MKIKYMMVATLMIVSCSDTANDPPVDINNTTADVGVDNGTRPDVASSLEHETTIASQTWTEIDDQRAVDLQAAIEAGQTELNLVGGALGVAVHGTKEMWGGAAGLSDREANEAWSDTRQIRIGSVSKTFTAAAIYCLMEAGVLSLDDDIEKWVPGYYDGLGVKVRHLLTMSSGIVSYNYVGSFDDTQPWTTGELVQWAVDREPGLRFEPGSKWEYSNTNYVLLGLIVEAATGKSFEEVLDAWFIQPLGLTDTYMAGTDDVNPNIVNSYGEFGDVATPDPSFGWAAGGMVSTPRDLARWGAALFSGDVLSQESFDLMVTRIEIPDSGEYAHGVFAEVSGAEALYGHTGGIGGFQTYMYHYATAGVTVVVVSNTWGTNLRDFSAYGWNVMLDL